MVVGDLAADVLLQLFRCCEEVYLPLMSNGEHQRGLPDVVAHEILDAFQRLVASIEAHFEDVGLRKYTGSGPRLNTNARSVNVTLAKLVGDGKVPQQRLQRLAEPGRTGRLRAWGVVAEDSGDAFPHGT